MDDSDGEPTLAEVAREFPEWACSTGVNNLCFARRGDVTVRGEDPWDLRNEIRRLLSREEEAAWRAAHGQARQVTGPATWAAEREWLPGGPAGLVLPPLTTPSRGWPGRDEVGPVGEPHPGLGLPHPPSERALDAARPGITPAHCGLTRPRGHHYPSPPNRTEIGTCMTLPSSPQPSCTA